MTNLRITTMRDAAVAQAVKGGGGWMVCPNKQCTQGLARRYDAVDGEPYLARCMTCNGKSSIRVHYIGRAMPGVKASPLGNPFKPGRDGTAAECLAMYADDVKSVDNMEGDPRYCRNPLVVEFFSALDAIIADLNAGRMVYLACWCCKTREPVWPPECHGDVLALVVKERMGV